MSGYYGSWPMTPEEGKLADRLSRGEAVLGGPGACATCAHLTLWHGRNGRYHGRPCQRCCCLAFTRPGEPARPRRSGMRGADGGEVTLFTAEESPLH